MARLLENQAGQVLKEASSVSTGGGNSCFSQVTFAVSQTSLSQSFAEFSVV
jgi:hypothetical protein